MLDRLVTELGIDQRAVYQLPGPLDLSGLSVIADLDLRQLKYPAFVPSEAALPQDTDIFTVLGRQDVLVHHPYDSFTATVERLIVEAAADPRVLAIKQTLYRTSDTSSIVDALIDAAEAGKQVVVVVEIKARFDERANIIWARKLEEAGCHVVYGLRGPEDPLQDGAGGAGGGRTARCAATATSAPGTTTPTTARLYEDFGLLTADRTVGEDATDLFNHLSGFSPQELLPAVPGRARGAARGPAGADRRGRSPGTPGAARPGSRSSATRSSTRRSSTRSTGPRWPGVPVDLWVRGICALRPGMPGLSENIRVRSILGRFLEHSRIYAFGDGRATPARSGSAPPT